MNSLNVPNPHLSSELHDRLKKAIVDHSTLALHGEIHHCLGSYLPERFCHVSNNDHGLKRILFDFDHAENVVLDGEGAKLICYGEVLPIRIGHSRNITVKNLTIDWFRPFFTQAEVTDSGKGWVEFQVDLTQYPLTVSGEQLVAHDGLGWTTSSLWNLLAFDRTRKQVLSLSENWHLHHFHRAKDLGQGKFHLEAAFSEIIPPGVPIVLMHGNRVAPGIFVEESENITIENVTVHHAPAMAFIAQLSRNIRLDHFHVQPSGERLFSSWVDATHFVDCNGQVSLVGCHLRGQFDDASNIHASFSKEVERLGPKKIRLTAIHPQRYGPFPLQKGCGIALHRISDMAMVLVSKVVETRQINQEICDVTLADPLPVDTDLIARRYQPEGNRIEIRDCVFGANRGRGLLLNMEHEILVENNHFHVSGRAIESVPDANYWWEAGPIENLTIRNNVFEDCNFGPCGAELIYLTPELPHGADPRYGVFRSVDAKELLKSEPAQVMKNIRIENNTIVKHSSRILSANGVEGLTFRGNKIIQSKNYPARDRGPEFEIGKSVSQVDIEGLS